MNDILKTKPISHSSLNLFEYSPLMYKRHVLKELEEEDTTYFRKGNAFDCLITEPDKFDEKFIIMNLAPPSGLMERFVETYIEIKEKNDSGLDEDTVLEHCYTSSQFKLKKESVLKKFYIPEIQNYITTKLENKDKTILSQEEYDKVKGMVQLLENDERCMSIMQAKDNPMIDVYDQFKIEWIISTKDRSVDARGMLDRLIIDHTNKKITIVDFKTTGKSIFAFPRSFVQYGYYRQVALYFDAIKYWIANEKCGLIGYKVINPIFIVVETNLNHPPMIYKTTDNDLSVGRHGGRLKNSKRLIKGYYNLIDELLWHRDNNQWDLPKEALMTGSTNLDVFE